MKGRKRSVSDNHFRSGFVSIVGRPNVGKWSLLNSIMGQKIVITSDKPQTTRNRIKGIHNIPGAQIVFIDTPGIHRATSILNRYMVEEALASIREVDVILFLVEAGAPAGSQESLILELVAGVTTPVILVINKIDLVPKTALLESIERYARLYPFREIIPVSARSGDGVQRIVQTVYDHLPEGPLYFPDEILTDVPERFIVAEIIRAKVCRLTHDEVPSSVAVEVESFKERQDGSLIAIAAVINVERDSQKGIIIGRKGDMLKKIGMQARREIEQLLDTKVFLELFVRVRKDWSENRQMLKELGYE